MASAVWGLHSHGTAASMRRGKRLNGLPQPYHPVFNAPNFALASTDRFFLCIESRDPRFDPVETRKFLESLRPSEVSEVAG